MLWLSAFAILYTFFTLILWICSLLVRRMLNAGNEMRLMLDRNARPYGVNWLNYVQARRSELGRSMRLTGMDTGRPRGWIASNLATPSPYPQVGTTIFRPTLRPMTTAMAVVSTAASSWLSTGATPYVIASCASVGLIGLLVLILYFYWTCS